MVWRKRIPFFGTFFGTCVSLMWTVCFVANPSTAARYGGIYNNAFSSKHIRAQQPQDIFC